MIGVERVMTPPENVGKVTLCFDPSEKCFI